MNIVIIAIVGVRVGVADDDVVLRTNLFGFIVLSSWRGVSHEYSQLPCQVVILLH